MTSPLYKYVRNRNPFLFTARRLLRFTGIGMEVQAQYPSGAQLFVQGDPRKVPRLAGGAVAAGVFVNGPVATPSRAGSVLWGVVSKQQALLNGAAGFSGEPESELTCIASGSRKRVRNGNAGHWFVPLGLQPEQTAVDGVTMDVGPSKVLPVCAGTPHILQVSNGNNRLNDSEMTSTTGRPHASALVPAATELGIPTLSEELVSLIHNQNLEIDAFIRRQVTDRLHLVQKIRERTPLDGFFIFFTRRSIRNLCLLFYRCGFFCAE